MGVNHRASRECRCPTCRKHPRSRTARQHRLLNRLVQAADERARRLLVGLFALPQGRGGITLFSRITGLSPHTIRRGMRELQRPVRLPPGRVRRVGGGRKTIETTRPKSSPPWRGCSKTPPPATR